MVTFKATAFQPKRSTCVAIFLSYFSFLFSLSLVWWLGDFNRDSFFLFTLVHRILCTTLRVLRHKSKESSGFSRFRGLREIFWGRWWGIFSLIREMFMRKHELEKILLFLRSFFVRNKSSHETSYFFSKFYLQFKRIQI